MERTVPSTASEEIDLYQRTVYSLLRSTADVQIRSVEEVQAGMNSLLHLHAREATPDTSALIYSILRLPDCITQVRLVVLGQSSSVFEKHGFPGLENWEPVSARARRRRCFFNGAETLACYIASQTDIDDIIPTLAAFQIEWNKLHDLLKLAPDDLLDGDISLDAISQASTIAQEDLERLEVIWGGDFVENLRRARVQRMDFRVRLLGGSLSDYWRATTAWWDHIERTCPGINGRPVYFVSSNTHSLANLVSGFALQHRAELEAYLNERGDAELRAIWESIQSTPAEPGRPRASVENFLYYLLKKAQNSPAGCAWCERLEEHEQALGIRRIPSEHSFEMEAQVFELNQIDPNRLDPRLRNGGSWEILRESDAIILNVDYPLGLAGYNILSKVAEHTDPVLGVYIMGKAATLNGVRGDVMIPNVVYDEHSENTYLFRNVFQATDVVPYLTFGTVMDNQKAVTVLGTFLQNARIMDVLYREGYTDIEMEAGPYLSAIYEMYRPERHPVNEIVNLYGVRFDLGVLHYASDKPLSKGKNLGAGALSYLGMDSTYACSISILRRIFQMEKQRCGR